MLAAQRDLSRRLTIAGSLWRLAQDEAFVDQLAQMMACTTSTMRSAHIDQVLWLGDGRSLDMLIELLDDSGAFVRYLALKRLNELEIQGLRIRSAADLPHSPHYYRAHRNDPAFSDLFVHNLRAALSRLFA